MTFTRTHYTGRQERLRRLMAAEDLDFYLTKSSSRLQYFIGFTGSNGLLILGQRGADFFTDGRYRVQAKRQVRGSRVHVGPGALISELRNFDGLRRGRPRVAYESHLMTEEEVLQLRKAVPKGIFVSVNKLAEPLIEVKDAAEIACIQKAADIAVAALEKTIPIIKPGVRERDVSAELEYHMSRAGSERAAFGTIVASGARSALPHGLASSKRIRKGDFVTMDFGAVVEGYASDITRTVVMGRATPRQRRVYDLVRRAQWAAVARAKPGAACVGLDRVARRMIARAGHAKRFDHGLGHGLGLQVHEGPSLNARSVAKLKSGMVITVEPGVYFPGWGGVRIEDDVVITPQGHKVLTEFERVLIEL